MTALTLMACGGADTDAQPDGCVSGTVVLRAGEPQLQAAAGAVLRIQIHNVGPADGGSELQLDAGDYLTDTCYPITKGHPVEDVVIELIAIAAAEG